MFNRFNHELGTFGLRRLQSVKKALQTVFGVEHLFTLNHVKMQSLLEETLVAD